MLRDGRRNATPYQAATDPDRRVVRRRARTARDLGVTLGALLLATACATPVGVVRGDTQDVYRTLTRNVLSAGQLSPLSEQTLAQLGLEERFEKEPEAVLAQLRGNGTNLGLDKLFTLAEASFLHAERTGQQAYYLASAIYAYGFFRDARSVLAPAIDPRPRLAADLYNLGFTRGLAAPRRETHTDPMAPPPTASEPDVSEVILDSRTLDLPYGQLELTNNPDDFIWSGYRLSRFLAVGDFKIRGLRNHYRQAGIGAALAAELTPLGSGPEGERARKHIAPRTKVPVTAVVRLDDVAGGIASGRLRGKIELYAADRATTIEVAGRTVPLELEPSAALAYQLEGAPVWQSELQGFLKAATYKLASESLFMMYPYRPGRVPVVLVHGTASSPARWADIVNEVQNDPVLRDHVQVWLFIYNTSNPILYSASELRRSLQALVTELDPEQKDPALRRMVLIGHSQGGLLTRLMVTDSGDRFWANVSSVPLAEVKMSPETRTLVERTFVFKPLPFVKRVIFVATPHRGSFRVSSLVLNLVRRLVTLPVTVVKGAQEAVVALGQDGVVDRTVLASIPTAVDNMRPGHPFIKTLAASPIADGVIAHSIVAVQGEGGPAGLNDGVVAYESAHIAGVASEKIVRSSHSTQSQPETILEIERILREHVKAP